MSAKVAKVAAFSTRRPVTFVTFGNLCARGKLRRGAAEPLPRFPAPPKRPRA